MQVHLELSQPGGCKPECAKDRYGFSLGDNNFSSPMMPSLKALEVLGRSQLMLFNPGCLVAVSTECRVVDLKAPASGDGAFVC
jgi:hypothetical protein